MNYRFLDTDKKSTLPARNPSNTNKHLLINIVVDTYIPQFNVALHFSLKNQHIIGKSL